MASAQTMSFQTSKMTMSSSTLPPPLSPSSLIQYARACGRCTPSLLPTDSELKADEESSFYVFVSKFVTAGVQGECAMRRANYAWKVQVFSFRC